MRENPNLIEAHRSPAIEQRLNSKPRSQYVSDAVLGGIDGCVTTFAVVSGAVGAGFSSTVAVILGFANLIADGFSMAVSNYESVKSQHEFVEGIRRTEEQHIAQIPEGEREEVRQIFERKGFTGDVLAAIVETITKDRRLWVNTMLTEEHGLSKVERSQWRSATVTFFAFTLVGTIPLMPFISQEMAMQQQYVYSTILAGLMFFLVGTLKALSFNKPIFRAGVTTLLTGGVAASLAFISGYLLRRVFGI